MTILKKLDVFWMHSSCNIAFRLQAYNAIIKAKFLYGLESMQLTEQQRQSLTTFHLKGLRKHLSMKTTFIDRDNTNARVYAEATRRVQQATGNQSYRIVPLAEVYMQ
eukprot:6330769-Prorocentrum_lima.AAC.1